MGEVARFGVLATTLVVSCSLIDLSSLGGSDASVDAAVEAPADGFVLTSARSHVTMDPSEGLDVPIDISRGATFSDVVDVTIGVVGLTNVSVPPSLVFTGSAPANLHIDVPPTTKAPQDGTITLTGVGRSTLASAPQLVLGVRVGSVLVDTQANASTPIPAYASSVTIKAWGAGGGAGTSLSLQNGVASGGYGGGGGMSGGIFAAPSGSTLTIVVGQPGKSVGGGSGGGYSIVSIGSTTLLVAGGGGGGSQGVADSGYCSTPQPTGNGLAGGGGDAEKSARSATMSAPGAAGDTAATAGTSYLGGNGSPLDINNCKFSCVDGGAPGGGTSGRAGTCTSSGGGGGGGGFWGGGGGSGPSHQGGGGGSGFVSDAGADVIQARGATVTPASTTDPDYLAGSATGGVASTDNSAAVPASPGRVIVRLPKP